MYRYIFITYSANNVKRMYMYIVHTDKDLNVNKMLASHSMRLKTYEMHTTTAQYDNRWNDFDK